MKNTYLVTVKKWKLVGGLFYLYTLDHVKVYHTLEGALAHIRRVRWEDTYEDRPMHISLVRNF